MAAQRNPRMARTPTPFRFIRGGRPVARPRSVEKPQVRYKRIGAVVRASNPQFNFSIRTIQNSQTKAVRVLFGRTSKQTKRTEWRIMSIRDYNREFAKKAPGKGEKKIQILTSSATMLAQHPDIFSHLGHELLKSAVHIVAMAA